jgi:hypothetical protein
MKNETDGFAKSPSAVLRLSAHRLRSKELTFLLCFAAFGRETKPPASQVVIYASFVIATYLYVRLIPQDSRALQLELFAVPSTS